MCDHPNTAPEGEGKQSGVHARAFCTKDPRTAHYSNRNWSYRFTCPICGATKRQNTNFLGSRELVCDGEKIRVVKCTCLRRAAPDQWHSRECPFHVGAQETLTTDQGLQSRDGGGARSVCGSSTHAAQLPASREVGRGPAGLPVPPRHDGTARIYTASRAVHGPKWLERRAAGAPITASWIDEWGEGQRDDWAAHWNRCLLQAATATALVLYAEEGESLVGALAEAGAALRAGVPVFYVGPDACIRKLARHRLLTRCASLDEAFARASSPDADDREAHTEHHGVYLDMPPAVAARVMLAERHPWPVLTTLLRDLLATSAEDRTLPASVRRWPSKDAFYADAEARVRALLTAEAHPSPTAAATGPWDDNPDGLDTHRRSYISISQENALRRQLAEAEDHINALASTNSDIAREYQGRWKEAEERATTAERRLKEGTRAFLADLAAAKADHEDVCRRLTASQALGSPLVRFALRYVSDARLLGVEEAMREYGPGISPEYDGNKLRRDAAALLAALSTPQQGEE